MYQKTDPRWSWPPATPMASCEPTARGSVDDRAFLLGAATTGAAVAVTGAAAAGLRALRDGDLDWQQAAADTLRAGLEAGVATAAAAAVGRMLCRYPILSVAATLATGTAVMYALKERRQPGDGA